MLCAELMKRDVARCLGASPVTEAADAMRDRNVGFLPVCDETGAARGTITDRDIVVRVLATGRRADATCVAEVMTAEVIWCQPDDELSVAEDLMIRFQRARIVCTDPSGRAVGVISLSDIAKNELCGHAGTIAGVIASREAGPSTVFGAGPVSCAEVMKSSVECCGPDEVVSRIASTMRDLNIGFVPVCEPSGRVTGTLTDRDLAVRVVAGRRDPDTTRADEVLTHDLVSCRPDDPLEVAEDLMIRKRKSRIVVCTERGRRPVGVISLADVARVEPARTVARLLREVSARPPHAAP